MKKLLSLALAAALLVTPALADQSTGDQNYFDANGIPVLQETPQELPLKYIAWAEKDPSLCQLREGTFTVDSCTVAPAADEGWQTVTLTVTANLEKYLDGETGTVYNWVSWTYAAYDYYTGEMFPRRDTVGMAVNEYTKNISYNGREFPVTYTQVSDWTHSGWSYEADGSATAAAVCTETWTFTVPSGYNGLVFGLFSTPEVPGLDPDKLDTATKYATKDEKSPQYFRFGHLARQEQPDGGKLDVSIRFEDEGWNLDNGISYPYQLTNRTDAPVRKYAALITYRPNLAWSQNYDFERQVYVPDKTQAPEFLGQIHAFDIDLQAGQTQSGTLVSCLTHISTCSLVWLEFDDLAERDRFFEDSVFGPVSTDHIEGYRDIDGTAGAAWMWDTFHIEIGPAV